jgi:hypothetical protein
MSVSCTHVYTKEYVPHSLGDDRAGFAEPPEYRNRSARGAITGVLLGAGLWGAILVLAGVIKL